MHIKDFQSYLNESLDSSFTVVSVSEVGSTQAISEKLLKFFGDNPLVYFSDEDEGLARKVNHAIWNLVSEKHPKYFTHTVYNSISNDPIHRLIPGQRIVRDETYQFYNDPIKGISKLVLMHNHPVSFLVLKEELETNMRALVASTRYGV